MRTSTPRPRNRLLQLLLGACGVGAVVALVSVVVANALEMEFTVVTPEKLTVAQWQRAIDERDYLVRLVLDPEQPEAAAGRWRASFNGEPIIFEMRERPAPSDVAAQDGGWRFAFSVPEALDTQRRLAGAMALVAYGLAAHGALLSGPRLAKLDKWATYVDIYGALGVGKRDEAVARYPRRVRPVGADNAIVLTIH